MSTFPTGYGIIDQYSPFNFLSRLSSLPFSHRQIFCTTPNPRRTNRFTRKCTILALLSDESQPHAYKMYTFSFPSLFSKAAFNFSVRFFFVFWIPNGPEMEYNRNVKSFPYLQMLRLSIRSGRRLCGESSQQSK